MTRDRAQLTIVIPAFNEEDRLPPTMEKVLEWADQTEVFEVELIIVDDGSRDQTCDIVQEVVNKDSRVRLIRETHVGAVNAIMAGFRAAKYPLVGNMDADLAVHPREYETLLPHVHEKGIAQGSRLLRGDGEIEAVSKSWVRKLVSNCFGLVFKVLFKNQVEDPQIGFRLYWRDSVLKIMDVMRLGHDGIKHGELVVRGYGLGMTVTEIPVTYIHGEDSRCFPKQKLKAAYVTLEACVALFAMWIQCSVDYQTGILQRSPARGAFFMWPFALFIRKKHQKKHVAHDSSE